MEERYNFSKSVWGSFRNGDFQEEDVWGVTKVSPRSHDVPVPVLKSMHSAARMIPSSDSHMTHEANAVQQSSAPVSIPNWSKDGGKKSKRVSKNHSSRVDVDSEEEDSDENGCDGEFEKMPPHEFIARRLERTRISSSSVFEGVGRKLKGRDLSKVRNGVLIKTGFLESV